MAARLATGMGLNDSAFGRKKKQAGLVFVAGRPNVSQSHRKYRRVVTQRL